MYPFGLLHKGYNNVVSSFGNATAQKYKFQGEELEEELGKNTYAYQWRDYDPAIGRFNKIDRFAEKYQLMTPYHFSANNPVFFREIAGDSINVADLYKKDKDGNYVNATQVKAFEYFAGTKTGKKYLSQFASKGQEIGGVKFDSNGKYHKEGIDLNYGGSPKGINSGDTGVGENNNRQADENGRFQINVNLGSESNVYESLSTIVHETFIHADRDAKDIMDNGKADHSIIDKDLMKKDPYRRHHYQEDRDARTQKRSLYSTKGYGVLKQGNAKFNKNKKSNTTIWNSMWDFVY